MVGQIRPVSEYRVGVVVIAPVVVSIARNQSAAEEEAGFSNESIRVRQRRENQVQQFGIDVRQESLSASFGHELQAFHAGLQIPPASSVVKDSGSVSSDCRFL